MNPQRWVETELNPKRRSDSKCPHYDNERHSHGIPYVHLTKVEPARCTLIFQHEHTIKKCALAASRT